VPQDEPRHHTVVVESARRAVIDHPLLVAAQYFTRIGSINVQEGHEASAARFTIRVVDPDEIRICERGGHLGMTTSPVPVVLRAEDTLPINTFHEEQLKEI
jgi:hypothetical protein